jgi:H+/gluconate symporter-like permease
MSLQSVRNFLINLTIFIGFILPIFLTLIGVIGYEIAQKYQLKELFFLQDWFLFHWGIIFGMTFGIPLILFFYILFYFLEKQQKNKTLQEGGDIEGLHQEKKKMPWGTKFLIIFLVFFLLYSFGFRFIVNFFQ